MKKWILLFSLFWGCQEDQPEPFDETLPKVDFTKFSIVESGGGFGMPTTYALSFSATIINQTDNVFKPIARMLVLPQSMGIRLMDKSHYPCFDGSAPLTR